MNKQLVIISFLSFLFLTILLVTSSEHGINKEVNFDSSFSPNLTQQKVGEIVFENTGILPKRAHLNSYIACHFDKEQTQTFFIELQGDIGYVYDELLEFTHYTDLSPKESVSIELYLQLDRFYYYEEKREQVLSSDLYVFKSNQQRYMYKNECASLNKEDAITTLRNEP